jgi:MarR family transcriptional regulator, organic hydroperoxide resistance regulator
MRQGGYLISKIHQLQGRIFSKLLKDFSISEINPAQGRILFSLWEKDIITIQELSKRTSLGKSTLTRMLDRLEESGHIMRVYPRDDRRKVIIQLIEENKKMKEAYGEVSTRMTQLFYKNFSNEDIDEFEGYLKRIFDNLERYEDNTK